MGDLDTQESSQPILGGSHHLPPYNVLCDCPRGPHLNEIAKVGTPATLGRHNFAKRPQIEMRSKVKL
jgi:hypothetical protein